MISDEKLHDLFHRLQESKAEGVDRPTITQEVEPAVISEELRARVLGRAADRSAELLGMRLREAAKQSGWTPDDWAEEAGSMKNEALELASGRGDPACLPAPLLAKLFARIGLDPRDVLVLLKQAVASNAVFPVPGQGVVYARTAGLSCAKRAAALESGTYVRDVEKGARVADAFADEVVDRWLRLKRSGD